MIKTETLKIYLKKDEAGLLVYDDPVKQVFDEPLIGGTDTLLYSLGYKEGDELEFTGGNDQPDLPIVAELLGEDQDNPNSHFYRVVDKEQKWLTSKH